MTARFLLGATLVATFSGGCTGASPRTPTGSDSATSGIVSRGPARLTVAIGAELANLATKLESANTFSAEYNFLLNSPLALLDERGIASPLLALKLPSRDTGSWVVNPDGTMVTVWRIRQNALWHDGTPITPGDFAFALKVYTDEAVPVGERVPERYMAAVDAIDGHAFRIYWKQPYPWANELISRQLDPLPEHIMGAVYDAGDRDAFSNHSFWSSASYVGNGPFRLMEWDRGSQLVFRAFDQFFLGRPKIDEIVFRVFGDPNTVVANLLGGGVDISVGSTLPARQAAAVEREWSISGAGRVVPNPTNFRHVRFQFERSRNQQPALLDLRVRTAVYQALDRAALAEVGSEGTSPVAFIPLAPSDPIYPQAMDSIAQFPYDVNRAQTLLSDAGWTRRGDTLMGASGLPFNVDLWTTPGSELEQPVVATQLGQLGMQVNQFVIPQSRMRDNEYRASFPGMDFGSLPVGPPRGLELATSDQCPLAERRFLGTNRSCWRNAEYDRLAAIAFTDLDPRERGNAWVQALKILTEDVALVGLSYNVQSIVVANRVVGPGLRWPGQSGSTWNVHTWEVR